MLIFTTNNRAICVSSSEWWHCKTLVAYQWTHLGNGRLRLRYLLISSHRAEEVNLWTSLVSLGNKSSWIRTACRSAVWPVGSCRDDAGLVDSNVFFMIYYLNTFLKGYSGVNLIHGLTHRETVLDSLSRDQVSRPLLYGVLSTSETTAREQYRFLLRGRSRRVDYRVQ